MAVVVVLVVTVDVVTGLVGIGVVADEIVEVTVIVDVVDVELVVGMAVTVVVDLADVAVLRVDGVVAGVGEGVVGDRVCGGYPGGGVRYLVSPRVTISAVIATTTSIARCLFSTTAWLSELVCNVR